MSDRVLVQGLYSQEGNASGRFNAVGARRWQGFTEHAEALGVVSYEWLDGRGRGLANRLLRRMRGTAHPVDAVEVIAINEAALHESLASEAGRARWQEVAGCASGGFDTARSFILMGQPIRLLEGESSGQKVLWFGNGLDHLSQAEFVKHYTTRHGPLVAGHAPAIGLHSYLQVPAEQGELCDALREQGLGQAIPPAVFARLIVGAPTLSFSMLRARRAANREIEADERRHIDFATSMLLLSASATSREAHNADTI
jgi:hypothetical protein